MSHAFPRRLFSTMLFFTPFAVHAQQPDTVHLPPVVVTATRVPTPATALSVSLSVLSGSDLALAGVRSVADALRAIPGAAVVQSGSFGAQTSLFLRGGESDYTKVLLNGVPLNQPGGAFDFAGLKTDNLERVEVLRGPASVLYGSDAVAGVVQIFTRDRRMPGTPLLTLGTRGGSYGTLESYASVAGGSGRAGWSIAGSRTATDGTLPFNNQSRTGVVDGRLHLAPDARSDVTLSARWDDHIFHFPTDGAGNLSDHNQFNTERGPTVGLEAGRFLATKLEGRVSVWTHHGELRYDDPQDDPGDTVGFYNDFHSRDLQIRSGADAHANLHLSSATVLTAGLGLEHEHDHSTNVCTGKFGDCSSPAIDTGRSTRSAYAQALAPLGDRADLTAGARLDHSSRFGDIATYRAGVAVRLGSRTRLRANVGTGFKEPTFLENFSTGFVIGNPSLKGERTTSGEVGLEQTVWGGRLTASATVFAQRFHDLIDYQGASAPGDPNYFNVAAATANGLEGRIAVRPVTSFTASVSYTFLRTRVTRSGFDSSAGAQLATGLPLIRRPAHTARLDLAWYPAARATVMLDVNYVGHRDDQDFSTFPAPRVRLPSYTRVDVAVRSVLWHGGGAVSGLALSARVENALNARYAEVLHFPAPHRTVLVGAEVAVGR